MNNRTSKTKVLVYSGHGEIVGGDAKYLFELLEHLDLDCFELTVCADMNPVFESRVSPSIRERHHIQYLDTRPRLFRKTVQENLYEVAERRANHSRIAPQLLRMMNASFRGRPLYDYIGRAWRIATLSWLTQRITNARVFYRLFKGQPEAPDVFHFSNGAYPGKEAGLIALIVARFFKVKKIIMTVHNQPEDRHWYNPSSYLFDLVIPRVCTRIIATCDTVGQDLIEKRGFPPDKVTTIYCGLADQEPPDQEWVVSVRHELGVEQTTPLLMICANFDEDRKGHSFLFHALARVVPEHPDLRLLIVGSGAPTREASLRGLARELGLEEQILFVGYRSDARALNAVVDVSVIPSVSFESLPYAVTEAVCLGTPVITTTVGGSHEAVDDQVTGRVVEPGDVEGLAQAIEQLVTDVELRKRMGARARSLYLETFELGRTIKKTENLYLQQV